MESWWDTRWADSVRETDPESLSTQLERLRGPGASPRDKHLGRAHGIPPPQSDDVKDETKNSLINSERNDFSVKRGSGFWKEWKNQASP